MVSAQFLQQLRVFYVVTAKAETQADKKKKKKFLLLLVSFYSHPASHCPLLCAHLHTHTHTGTSERPRGYSQDVRGPRET